MDSTQTLTYRPVPGEHVRLQDGQVGIVVDTQPGLVRVLVLVGQFKGYTLHIAPEHIRNRVTPGWVDILPEN